MLFRSNNPKLRALVPQELWLHPEDAKPRNIKNHDLVLVYNSRGTIRIPAKITTRIRPGVVAVPQGAWFDPDQKGVDQGGCINTLTSLRPTPIAKANAQHTILVEVKKDSNCIKGTDSVIPGSSIPDNSMPDNSIQDNSMPDNSIRDSRQILFCTGCLTCVASCPHGRMKVLELPSGEQEQPIRYLPLSCGQCGEPACKASCPLRIL